MNHQKQPKKTFITINKLINGLNDKELLNGRTMVRVLFDDVMEANYYNKRIRNIRVLSIDDIDINELFNIAGGTNVWLNVSTQLNNVKLPIVKRLNELSIDVKPTSCKSPGGEITFYKITYVNTPNTDKNKQLMNKLNNELSKKHVARFNACVSSFVRDDSDFFDE